MTTNDVNAKVEVPTTDTFSTVILYLTWRIYLEIIYKLRKLYRYEHDDIEIT